MPRKKQEEVIEAKVYEKKPPKVKKEERSSNRKVSRVTTKKETVKVEKVEEMVEAEIVESKEDKNTKKKDTKPYFFPRLIAYVIDIFLVSVIVSGITFLLPENENRNKYMKEYEQIQGEFFNQDITYQEFMDKSKEVVYDIDYSNVVSMMIEVVVIILYFVIFVVYNKGQTLGKKFMKLRVVSTKGETLTVNQVALRSLLVNSILVDILIMGSVLFIGRNYYFYASMGLQYLAMMIEFAILLMILFRKDGRGLHDVIASTQVIQEN